MKVVTLGSLIFDEVSGASIKRDQFTQEGVPVVPKKAINQNIRLDNTTFNFTSQSFADRNKKSIISDEHYVTTLRNLNPDGSTLGLICESESLGGELLAQGLHAFRVKSDVCARYLCHVSRSPTFRQQVLKIKVGSTQVHIRARELKEVKIPLPPLAEQKRIAAILDKADALRRKRQQAIDLADQFLRSVFLEMFGDPVSNPKGWPTKPLSQMASVITGYPFKSSDYIEESKGTVRLCRGVNVLPGALDWKDTRFWSRDRLDGLDDYLLEQGDIILAMDRPWISSGLKVCQADVSDIPTYLVQRVARIRAGTQSMQDLIYASIDSVAFERHCCPTETTIPHISPVELKAFPIFDVPADLLERFSRVVRASLRKTKSFAFAEYQSEVLFSSISQQAFRGDL